MTMFPRNLLPVLFICLVGMVTRPVGAAALTLTASASPIHVSDSVSVELAVSGLSAGGGTLLGAFDLVSGFDNPILPLDSVLSGTSLGDPADPVQTDIITSPIPTLGPSVGLTEVSQLPTPDLQALQSDSFLLATLIFTGIDVGTSAISIGSAWLYDDVGGPITLSATNATSVEVQPAAAVPEGDRTIAFLLAIGWLGGWRWIRGTRRNRA